MMDEDVKCRKVTYKQKKNLKTEIGCETWHLRYSRIRCFRACSILHNSVNYVASKVKYAYVISVGLASFDTSRDFLQAYIQHKVNVLFQS